MILLFFIFISNLIGFRHFFSHYNVKTVSRYLIKSIKSAATLMHFIYNICSNWTLFISYCVLLCRKWHVQSVTLPKIIINYLIKQSISSINFHKILLLDHNFLWQLCSNWNSVVIWMKWLCIIVICILFVECVRSNQPLDMYEIEIMLCQMRY